MADTFTQLSSVLSDQVAFDKMAYFALRDTLYFDQIADVKSTQTGTAVKFTIYSDLGVATSALSETADVDAVPLSDAQITVTLVEQGNAVITSAKLRGTSFFNVDEDAANIVGRNAALSLDAIIVAVLAAGTNVVYSGTATATNSIKTTDTCKALDVRKIRAAMVSAFVQPKTGGSYTGFIHPDVALDLMTETGQAAWTAPHAYVDTDAFYTGEVGRFAGIRFIETARANIRVNASNGTSSAGNYDVYDTVVVGEQALAKAWSASDGGSEFPTIVHGATVDKLMRFKPVGWKQLVGYSLFRTAATRRIESYSSIGANAS